MLRKQRFEELVTTDSLGALHYLQTSLSELVNHSDPVQSKEVSSYTLLSEMEADAGCCHNVRSGLIFSILFFPVSKAIAPPFPKQCGRRRSG